MVSTGSNYLLTQSFEKSTSDQDVVRLSSDLFSGSSDRTATSRSRDIGGTSTGTKATPEVEVSPVADRTPELGAMSGLQSPIDEWRAMKVRTKNFILERL